MDYEKAYLEALDRAKAGKPMDEVFPELKESEDERIRKMLIEQMERWHECALENNVVQDIKDSADAISYLEKQKEQKSSEMGEFGYNLGREKGMAAGIEYVLNHLELYGLCKPAEWSEEDIKKIRSEEYTKGFNDAAFGGKLKEWSEEDEGTLQEIVGCIEQARADSILSEDHCLRLESFLYKHFRPQPHWKPSEEQIYSLGTVVKGAGENSVGSIAYNLKELYEELKKL